MADLCALGADAHCSEFRKDAIAQRLAEMPARRPQFVLRETQAPEATPLDRRLAGGHGHCAPSPD